MVSIGGKGAQLILLKGSMRTVKNIQHNLLLPNGDRIWKIDQVLTKLSPLVAGRLCFGTQCSTHVNEAAVVLAVIRQTAQ